MKKIFVILFCVLGISVYAVDYTPATTQQASPSVNMQSVNNSSMMSSGSVYRSDIQEVGAQSPTAAAGPRKAPPGHGEGGGYDPSTPPIQQPLGDALLPLMLFAGAFLIWRAARRRAVKE